MILQSAHDSLSNSLVSQYEQQQVFKGRKSVALLRSQYESPTYSPCKGILKKPPTVERRLSAPSVYSPSERQTLPCQRQALRRVSFTDTLEQEQLVSPAAQASLKIQAAYRGWRGRMHWQITFLERCLEESEELRTRQLGKIKRNKQREFKRIRKERREQVSAQDVSSEIQALKEDNKRIREENERLARDCEQLSRANYKLEYQIEQWEHRKASLPSIPCLEAQATMIGGILEQMEERKKEFQNAITQREEYFQFERKVSKMMAKSISNIVNQVDLVGHDQDLIDEIEELERAIVQFQKRK